MSEIKTPGFLLCFSKVLSSVKQKAIGRSLAASHSSVNLTDELMPCVKGRSSKLKFKTWRKQWQTSCWLSADKRGRKKNTHMKGSNTLLNDGSKAANHLVSVFWVWFLLAEKLVVMWECESTHQGLKYCTSSEWQVALIYWHIQHISSGTDWAIHDWGPLNHCTVRFRLSSPFDSLRWVVLFPPPLLVSSFVRPNRYIRISVALL